MSEGIPETLKIAHQALTNEPRRVLQDQPDLEEYFRVLEEYWSLFDWREAVKRCWKPGRFHDIRL